MAFEISIPTGKGGESSGGSDNMQETNKLLKKLDKSILKTVDVGEILMQFLGDTLKLLSPLIKVLSLLFLVIFLPLLPLIIGLTESIAKFIDFLLKALGGSPDINKWLQGLVAGIFIAIGAVLLFIVGGWIVVLIGAIGALIYAFWDEIMAAFEFIWESWQSIFISLGEMWGQIWNWLIGKFKAIGEWFASVPDKLKGLWEKVKAGWDWLAEKMPSLWDDIKAPFLWIANKMKGMINHVIGFVNRLPGVSIPKLAKGGIVSSPTIAMIGEAGPEAVVPLDKMGSIGTTININNPVVREDADIRKLTNSISRELQKRGSRGFSG